MNLHLNSRARIIALIVLIFAPLTLLPAHGQPAKRKSSAGKARKAASNVRFVSGRSALGIPLEMDGNTIFLRVRVNDSPPLKFIFDTGAGMTVINARLAASMKLKAHDKAKGTGIGGSLEGTFIKGISLGVPGVKVFNQPVAAFPFDAVPACAAGDIDGIIGYEFIKEFVVEIDYAAKTLNLHDPQSYTYSSRGEIIPLTIERTPFVHATVALVGRAPVEGKFEIDTGSDGTLSINKPFVEKHKLLADAAQTSKGSNRGLGGESETISVRLKSLQLGSFVLQNPVVDLSLATEGSLASETNDGPIGNEILRRFKVIIDYSRQRMMLEPESSLADPFQTDTSGFAWVTEGEDCKTLKVESVAENSPASEAGLLPGDVIKAIDGRPVESFPSGELEGMFVQEDQEHLLSLERDKKPLQVRIKLRRLI
jgi:predicted aspartyl protease